MKLAQIATLALSAFIGAPQGSATSQVVEGTIAVGNPTTIVVPGITERFGKDANAIDGHWIDLARATNGSERVLLSWTSAVEADLDVFFYRADGTHLTWYACATTSESESCAAPPTATRVLVSAFSGADVHFVFEMSWT